MESRPRGGSRRPGSGARTQSTVGTASTRSDGGEDRSSSSIACVCKHAAGAQGVRSRRRDVDACSATGRRRQPARHCGRARPSRRQRIATSCASRLCVLVGRLPARAADVFPRRACCVRLQCLDAAACKVIVLIASARDSGHGTTRSSPHAPARTPTRNGSPQLQPASATEPQRQRSTSSPAAARRTRGGEVRGRAARRGLTLAA